MEEYKKTKKRTISKFLEIVKKLNFFVSDATNLKISYKVKCKEFWYSLIFEIRKYKTLDKNVFFENDKKMKKGDLIPNLT